MQSGKGVGAISETHWRKRLQVRATPSPLDESVLIQNLQRLAAGDGAVSLKANTFLLTHCFGWSEYTPPPREPQVGKKEAIQRDVEDGPDEGTEWHGPSFE